MINSLEKKAVVLLSGGLDSAVTLAIARHSGFSTCALSISYGQRHAIELQSAKQVALSQKVDLHKIVNLDLCSFGGSALTASIEVPKDRVEIGQDSVPITYVPARNMIFLSLAIAWAESFNVRDIFIGVSSVDYSGYPDCRSEFIDQFQKTANLGTRSALSGLPFVIHAPLINLSKAQTIKMGLKLGVDFSLTWTCYDPQANRPCLGCDACLLRAKGFADLGIADPFLTR